MRIRLQQFKENEKEYINLLISVSRPNYNKLANSRVNKAYNENEPEYVGQALKSKLRTHWIEYMYNWH